MNERSETEFDLPSIMQGIVPVELRAKGWRYIDPPTRFSHEMWDYFLRLLGEGEYRILAASSGVTKDGFAWKRGQFIVSPQALANLADKDRQNAMNHSVTA